MHRVRLLGELGELFGEDHTYYNLQRPADAIKLLCINRPAFKQYLLDSEDNGIGFRVIQANVDMSEEELLLPLGKNDLVIAPVLTGSGNSPFGKIIAGAALLALSFVAAPISALLGNAFVGIGASLALGGVAQLLSPQPELSVNFGSLGGGRFGSNNRTAGPQNVTRGIDGRQSYAYLGAANTVGVGATVPLAYGKVLIGSHLLRSKVQVTDDSDPIMLSIKKPGINTMIIGGEKFFNKFRIVSGADVKKVTPFKQTFKAKDGGATNLGASGDMELWGTSKNSAQATTDSKTAAAYQRKFNVAFVLTKGLNNAVSGSDSTLVDAYVTYEIKVYRGSSSGSIVNIVASDTVTIQGLLTSDKDNRFAYIHKMRLPPFGDSKVTVRTKIIDSDADSPCVLRMAAIGYELS